LRSELASLFLVDPRVISTRCIMLLFLQQYEVAVLGVMNVQDDLCVSQQGTMTGRTTDATTDAETASAGRTKSAATR
jgi:hypothetical protein